MAIHCKTCGDRVALVALARHAQLAHSIEAAQMVALGKGDGLVELCRLYEERPDEPGT